MLPRLFLVPLLLLLSASIIANGATITTTTKKEEDKAFYTLVKTIEEASNGSGFVHPSIGILSPAPSGAPRGIGIVKKMKKMENDVLIKVPYSYQMTRELALSTLSALIPPMVLVELPLQELDDAALLVLLLAHEYGLGKNSKFHAYIKTLPDEGGCGWASNDAVEDFRKLPMSVEPDDVEVALNYVHRVSNGMAAAYAEYLEQSSWPKEWKEDSSLALRWSLCTVSSRGTAANAAPGDSTSSGVRLVPLADLANHWKVTGGYIELSGNERMAKQDFMDATLPDDAGAFVIRSIWKCGTKRELTIGDEITVNYNLPDYRAVDWFLSLGFVPAEVFVLAQEQKSTTATSGGKL